MGTRAAPIGGRSFRIGVDIGGTFTDFTVVDDAGGLLLWKEDSTPSSPELAIERGLEAVARGLGLGVAELLERTRLLVHGTTIATNTVIQRNGPRLGLVCTQGFRDVLYFRDGYKPERFNIQLEHPPDFVERQLRIGVRQRMGPRGEELVPLDEDDVVEAARLFREAGVQSVAVALLWSIVDPAHEHRAAEILRAELPGVPVLCSSDVLPEIREWERTSAAVLGAYVLPGIGEYLTRFERLVGEHGFPRPPLIMQLNGGCASVAEILHRPVYALASGPAAAPAAATFHAADLDLDDLIVVDMGGTSLDVCLVREGRPAMSRAIEIDGNPVGVAGVEVSSVGAGGGSIAWVDSGGALRVGPRSAGASPGPACYGTGGDEPTVTDANVVLGYLSPTAFLGGRRTLDADRARVAVARIAKPLGLDELEAASGIVRVVDVNMVAAIRAMSVERGIDPRGYTLVVAGGAGGLHATRLARALGITRVVVPIEAGTFCAFGMTVTDVRHDLARAFHAISTSVHLARLDALFRDLEEEAGHRLRQEGFSADEIRLERSVDARYPSQVHELTIPIAAPGTYSDEHVHEICSSFHTEHERQFTYSRPELPVEFLHWRLAAYGHTARPPASKPNRTVPPDSIAGSNGFREAYFAEAGGLARTAIHVADRLAPGATVEGPAVIQAATTTVVVNPGETLRVRSGSWLVDVPVTAKGAQDRAR